MANRHLARSIVMQTLFEWDFTGHDAATATEKLLRNAADFGPGIDDTSFLEDLLNGVVKKHTLLDEIIAKAAPDWPIEKIAAVDRNVLRLGLYELLFGDRDQVPPKVAINEAIELAKTFGGENSGRFVNGVLGAIYKEIGEPGKDQVTRKKKRNEPVDLESLPIEKKAGAVVYSIDDDETIRLALVHDVFGYWTLSKGSVEPGETESEAAKREIKEEISLDIEVGDLLGQNEYIANHPEQGKIRRQVHYFLSKSDYVPVQLEESGGLDEARWFELNEVPDLTMYDDIMTIITKAIHVITEQS